MLGNKHALSACYVCEVMHAMSIRLTLLAVHTLNTMNNNTARCLLVDSLLMSPCHKDI